MEWPPALLAPSCAIPAAIDAELAAYLHPDHRAGVRAYILAEIRGRLAALAEVERLQAVLAQTTRLNHQLAAECVDRLHDQERLRAHLATQQAVIDAVRWIEEDGWTPATRLALMGALVHLPAENARAAQPKAEP